MIIRELFLENSSPNSFPSQITPPKKKQLDARKELIHLVNTQQGHESFE